MWNWVGLGLAALLALPGGAFAYQQTCAGIVAGTSPAVPVTHRLMAKTPDSFKEAFSDYDPSTDVLFAFQGVHVSLYAGKYFWDFDSANYTVRENPRAIAAGTVVRVKVGAATVKRIETYIANKEYEKIAMGTCELRQLILLQANGVKLNARIPLTGIRLFEGATQMGFTDELGKPYPHDVVVLHTDQFDPWKWMMPHLREHHVDWFLLFMSGYGLPPEHFAADLAAHTDDAELIGALPLMADQTRRGELTLRQRAFYLELLLRAEWHVQNGADANFGGTHVALDHIGRHGVPPGMLGAGLRQALGIAMRELLPKHGARLLR